MRLAAGLASSLGLLGVCHCSLLISTDGFSDSTVEARDASSDAANDADATGADASTDARDDATAEPYCMSVEAESGTLSAPMGTGTDPNASGGTYVFSSTGKGFVSWSFTVPRAGSYVLKARVFAGGADNSQNSFYVGLDGDPAQDDEAKAFHTYSLTTSWMWDAVSWAGSADTSELDPKVWDLTAGIHVFTFYSREAFTEVDRVALAECPAEGCAALPDADCD